MKNGQVHTLEPALYFAEEAGKFFVLSFEFRGKLKGSSSGENSELKTLANQLSYA